MVNHHNLTPAWFIEPWDPGVSYGTSWGEAQLRELAPRTELANLYATLTELNHFSDPAIPFTAQYGADGVRMRDEGNPPFDAVYLLTGTHRTPQARRDAVAHLGSYLFHDLTTPLGSRLDHSRRARDECEGRQHRGLGTARALPGHPGWLQHHGAPARPDQRPGDRRDRSRSDVGVHEQRVPLRSQRKAAGNFQGHGRE